jgi:hypothetical protein
MADPYEITRAGFVAPREGDTIAVGRLLANSTPLNSFLWAPRVKPKRLSPRDEAGLCENPSRYQSRASVRYTDARLRRGESNQRVFGDALDSEFSSVATNSDVNRFAREIVGQACDGAIAQSGFLAMTVNGREPLRSHAALI